MDTSELILYAGIFIVFAAAAGLFVFTFFRQSFVGHNKLKMEAPLLKGRSSIHTPRFGWCESIGHDDTGDNSAIYHLKDTYGNVYQTESIYDDELIPHNIRQNINGPGNQYWYYRPRRDRSVAAIDRDNHNVHLRQQAALSKEHAETAAGYAKQATVNIEQEVQRRIEHATMLEKSRQQPTTVRR